MKKQTIIARCLICNNEFTEAEIENAQSCPRCGTKSIPCDPKNDVLVKINWHELRILTIWANNWAAQHDGKEREGTNMPLTIQAIVSRLQMQYPDKTPLTLTGEITQLHEKLGLDMTVTQNGKTTKYTKKRN